MNSNSGLDRPDLKLDQLGRSFPPVPMPMRGRGGERERGRKEIFIFCRGLSLMSV